MIDWITCVLLLIGTGFIVTSSVGLMRMPDFYTRMHGATKASTLGVACVLLASVVYFSSARGVLHIRELLVIVFILMTSPVGAHMLSKAARSKQVPFFKETRFES